MDVQILLYKNVGKKLAGDSDLDIHRPTLNDIICSIEESPHLKNLSIYVSVRTAAKLEK